MKICFRVDSSTLIGAGHLMRCLTLAESLQKRRCQILFMCRELPGNLNDLVEKTGYRLHRLPYSGATRVSKNDTENKTNLSSVRLGDSWETDAAQTKALLRSESPTDWLIVDHYALDEKWEKIIRSHTKNVMVIDDLADRRHDCDLLLDQNLYEDMEKRYDGLIPSRCRRLLGPSFALLRSQFDETRQNLRKRDSSISRILISFGGADSTGETEKALDAIRQLSRPEISVDVVVGMSNPRREAIKTRCEGISNVTFHCQADNMATLMARADLAIGAGGTTTWERCCLGLPSLIISVAFNQEAIAEAVAKIGAAVYLGRATDVTAVTIRAACEELLQHPERLAQQSLRARDLVDCSGAVTVASVLAAQLTQKCTVLFLGPPRKELVNFLSVFGDDVRQTGELLSVNSDMLQNVDFIISYGYRHLLMREVLERFRNRVLNLHIALLPWNKGADPNLWSFLEDTPKGVTIHYMDEKLDNGDIIAQQEVSFGPDETLQTSYATLSGTIEGLFRRVWPEIRSGENRAKPMPPGGSFHSLRDRKSIEHLLTKGWETPVRGLIGMAKKTNA